MLTTVAVTLALAQGDWRTHYERSGYLETGRYAEAVQFCRRLDAASEQAKAFTFGTSPEGREMIALAISSEGALTGAQARRSKKPLIVVQNGIHSGEIEGKDASLMFARDLLIHGKHEQLLKGANILFIPVFSLDAHERFGPYNRINQNGPKEMGWRATAQNLNLNRDYIKADSGEMRALLRLLRDWKPDFFFDNHTTDGSDHQYVVTLALPMAQTLDPALAKWSRDLYEKTREKLDKDGFLTGPYFDLEDQGDPTKGISVGDYSPRFSIGYMAAINRPSVLVETHMLKAYKPRVDGTYWTMVRIIEECVKDASRLKSMIRSADDLERSTKQGSEVVLQARTTDAKRPFTFKGYPFMPYRSEISGAMIPKWDTSKPVDFPSTFKDQFDASQRVQMPAAYAVPRQWTAVVELLQLHGLMGSRMPRDYDGVFDSVRFTDVKFSSAPFESHFAPSFKAVRSREKGTLKAGTWVFPVSQVGAKLLAHMLEAEAPDSLLKWGFFNVIFEPKEYAEDYAMEPVAAEMLKKDAALRAEFEANLKDEAFAKDAGARLHFFYERSPWFDKRLNQYPVVRLDREQLAAAMRK